MKVIAVLGRKGGGGKTACSHILATAFGLAEWKPIMIQTDLRTATPPTKAPSRPYWLFGLNTSEQPEQAATAMAQIFERSRDLEKGVVILDGGANRDAVDEGLARRADLVLVPVADGPEDFEVAMSDQKRFRESLERHGRRTPVRLLLNRWPGVKTELEAFLREEYVSDFMAKTRGDRLETVVPRMRSTKALLDHSDPDASIPVRRVGRQLLAEIEGLLSDPAGTPKIPG